MSSETCIFPLKILDPWAQKPDSNSSETSIPELRNLYLLAKEPLFLSSEILNKILNYNMLYLKKYEDKENTAQEVWCMKYGSLTDGLKKWKKEG